MKVKLFWVKSPMRDTGMVIADSGGNARAAETQINEWLEKNSNIDVRYVQQSAYGYGSIIGESVWLISVWYASRVEASTAD
jgi:hypothetical protein